VLQEDSSDCGRACGLVRPTVLFVVILTALTLVVTAVDNTDLHWSTLHAISISARWTISIPRVTCLRRDATSRPVVTTGVVDDDRVTETSSRNRLRGAEVAVSSDSLTVATDQRLLLLPHCNFFDAMFCERYRYASKNSLICLRLRCRLFCYTVSYRLRCAHIVCRDYAVSFGATVHTYYMYTLAYIVTYSYYIRPIAFYKVLFSLWFMPMM